MIRTGQLFDRVWTRAARRVLGWWASCAPVAVPEPAYVAIGAFLLGLLTYIAFTTRVPDMERLPAEVVFGFLGLYFYSVGYLSGRRTGRVGTGSWAGAASGLAFGAMVCLAMYHAAVQFGVREAVRSGSIDQVAVAVTGLGFFIALGAICGALGARSAVYARRRHL